MKQLDTQKIADIISPLVDRLEQLRSQAKLDNSNPTGTKPFPTLEEFLNWVNWEKTSTIDIHDYFAQFRYETMPEVGKEYIGNCRGEIIQGTLEGFDIGGFDCDTIEPVKPPSREQILKKARQVLSEDEIEILTGGKP